MEIERETNGLGDLQAISVLTRRNFYTIQSCQRPLHFADKAQIERRET